MRSSTSGAIKVRADCLVWDVGALGVVEGFSCGIEICENSCGERCDVLGDHGGLS